MEGYDAVDNDIVQKNQQEVADHLYAFIYLENADSNKYGSVLKGLSEQQALGNNQYLKKTTEASNVLSNHRFDNYKPRERTNRHKNGSGNGEDISKLSFAQIANRCYYCGKQGRKLPDYRLKDTKPKEEWWINKVERYMHAHVTNVRNKDSPPTNDVKSGTSDDKPAIG